MASPKNFIDTQEYEEEEQEGDTYSYEGLLNSDYFWKRCIGVFGYLIVAQISVGFILFALVMIAEVISSFL